MGRKDGMPPIFVYEGPKGQMEISDGVTRAVRIAKVGTRGNGPGRCDRAISPKSGQFATCDGPIMSENETRAELFVAFRELCEIVPEMRAGQLMAAVGELCSDLHGRGLWEASDTELLEAVWQFRRNFEASTVRPSPQGAARQ